MQRMKEEHRQFLQQRRKNRNGTVDEEDPSRTRLPPCPTTYTFTFPIFSLTTLLTAVEHTQRTGGVKIVSIASISLHIHVCLQIFM